MMPSPEEPPELVSAPNCRMDWSIRFTPRAVMVSWTWYRWGRETRYRLHDLDPEFGHTEMSRDVLNTAFGLLSAFFVYVALQQNGTRHETAYWIIAVVCWAVFLLHLKRGKTGRTMVKRKDGTYAFVLDHKDFDAEALQVFLKTLSQKIREERDDLPSEGAQALRDSEPVSR